MFVVQVSRDDMPFDMKVFDELADAVALAKGYAQGGDDAKVYRVADAKNAQAAVAAVEVGSGELMVAPARRRSVAEKAQADRKAWRKLLNDL
jgi:hypothetical protein